MHEIEKAAYIISQAACAVIETTGMAAENKQREQRGESLAYDEADFERVINKYGIHHNAVIGYLKGL